MTTNIDFLDITSKRDVAECLGGTLKSLSYYLYHMPQGEQYKEIIIRKRSGGERTICAPISRLKQYQRSLSDILQTVVPPKSCVHAYTRERSVKTNAVPHRHKRIVVNLDLKDFFPSIHFGRVKGVFAKEPFLFNDVVATTLAQICCYKQALPQGAPSSPVISNLVCRTLDNQLLNLARKHKLSYSRYADDITFSTNLKSLPAEIGIIDEERGLFIPSERLREIIESNQFRINESKLRYSYRNNRQEVTGLVVNEIVNVRREYVRKIRCMLHAWKKHGLEAAAREHFCKYLGVNLPPAFYEEKFKCKLLGMISYVGHIKGLDNSVYNGLYNRLVALDSNVNLAMPMYVPYDKDNAPIVYCEGITDAIHLRTALDYFKDNGKFKDLNIVFFNYRKKDNISNSALMSLIEMFCRVGQSRRVIGLFDRDDSDFGPNKVLDKGKEYKNWGNNVYTCLLPRIDYRPFEEICIEHFYNDEDLKTADEKGRRIYLSTEFNPDDNKYIADPENLMYRNRNHLKSAYPRIIAEDVVQYSTNGKNVALSKKAFADNIANKVGQFANVSFGHFEPVFEMLGRIIKVDNL